MEYIGKLLTNGDRRNITVSVELLQKHLDINVVGAFLCFKYAAAHMINQGRGGRLLVASSICGQSGKLSTNMSRRE